MKLTSMQIAQIEVTRQADQAWRDAKREVQRRAAEMIENELRDYLTVRDREVRKAVEMGAPLTQIGRLGLGSTSPHIVPQSLARTVHMTTTELAVKAAQPVPSVRFRVTELDAPVPGQKIILVVMFGEDWDWWVKENKSRLRNDSASVPATAHAYLNDLGEIFVAESREPGAIKIDHLVARWLYDDGADELRAFMGVELVEEVDENAVDPLG